MTLLGHDITYQKLWRLDPAHSAGRSLLLVGHEGIGKKSVAIEWIRAILCDAPTAQNDVFYSCGECPSCTQLAQRTSPELLFVAPGDSGILIGSAREAKAWAAMTPLYGKKKFLVIDDAHTLHRSAANAILKLAEEPGPDLFVLFITSQPSRLPITIRSRCVTFSFSPPPWNDAVAAFLEEKLPDTPRAILATWFRIWNGGIGVMCRYPLADWEVLRQTLFLHCIAAPAPASADLLERLKTFKKQMPFVFDLIATFISDMAKRSSTHSNPLIHADLFAAAAISPWTEAIVQERIDVLLNARRAYRDVLHFELFWEDFFYQWQCQKGGVRQKSRQIVKSSYFS